jgi:hypothetical protein
VELKLHTFLISALEEDVFTYSRPAAFCFGKSVWYVFDQRVDGLQSPPGSGDEEKNYFNCRNLTWPANT